MSTLLAHMVWP